MRGKTEVIYKNYTKIVIYCPNKTRGKDYLFNTYLHLCLIINVSRLGELVCASLYFRINSDDPVINGEYGILISKYMFFI